MVRTMTTGCFYVFALDMNSKMEAVTLVWIFVYSWSDLPSGDALELHHWSCIRCKCATSGSSNPM